MPTISNSLINPKNPKLLKPKSKLRVGVMASGEGTNFQALAQASKYPQLGFEIVLLIVNNHHCGALKKAKTLNIPSIVINHL